jgi:hypothetical protein
MVLVCGGRGGEDEDTSDEYAVAGSTRRSGVLCAGACEVSNQLAPKTPTGVTSGSGEWVWEMGVGKKVAVWPSDGLKYAGDAKPWEEGGRLLMYEDVSNDWVGDETKSLC